MTEKKFLTGIDVELLKNNIFKQSLLNILNKINKKEDLTISEKVKMDYLKSGKTLPKCSSLNCNNYVTVRNWTTLSFKCYCSKCQTLMKNNIKETGNVTLIKKDYCENIDGRLGFNCPIDENFDFRNSDLQLDHKDGNNQNNRENNIQTLCLICHSRKSIKNKDFNSYRKTSKRNVAINNH